MGKKSKVIGQLQGYRVKQVYSWSQVKGISKLASSTIAVFKSKNQIEDGFKTKEDAMKYISGLL